MATVFVSHASEDTPLAGEVHGWLTEDGHQVFLDRDLDDGIHVGDRWEARLHERLRWADAVVCLVTPSYVASVWCAAELGIAQSRGSRVLPLRTEPRLKHPLLGSVQYTDVAEDRTAARTRLARALRQVDRTGGFGWPDGRSPFPGLRALDTDEHSVFFGRGREVDQLATLLRSPAERAERAVVLVVGPSGCGKSSLVRAGLLPVMAGEPEWWTVPAVLPGARPVAALAGELAATARQLGLSWTPSGVQARLDAGELCSMVDDLLAAPERRRRHLLLVVDQFEELLAQTAPDERARFARILHEALSGSVQVVATLRPEFLEPLLADPGLSALPVRTETLRPLRSEALRSVVTGPAARAGIGVDDELVTRLVEDTSGGEALPLLAYTLARLADGVSHGGRLLAGRYEELGGVHGALAGQADLALERAVEAGGRSGRQVVQELLRLVTVDDQGRPTRRRIRREDLPARVRSELQPFVERRLLTTDTGSDGGPVVMTVAHEAFLSAWPPLREAIAVDASAIRARSRVEKAAEEWVEHGRAPERLWEGGQLTAALSDLRVGARRSVGRPTPDDEVLSADARDFLKRGVRRARRRRRRAVVVVSALLVVAAFAAVQLRASEREQRLSAARLLLNQADAVLEQDPRTALRLAEAAIHLRPGRETRSALTEHLLTTPYAGTFVEGAGPLSAVAVTPDGRTLVTGGADGGVALWDVTDPAGPRARGSRLTTGDQPVERLVVDPAGGVLASSSDLGGARLWDLTDPDVPGTALTAEAGGLEVMAFRADGTVLATAVSDGSVLLWDVSDPARPRRLGPPLVGHEGRVFGMSFGPGGVLSTAGHDGTVQRWDVTDPDQPRLVSAALLDDAGSVYAAAFTPDGNTLATTGPDSTIVLWDVGTTAAPPRRIGLPLTGHTDLVDTMAFDPRGRILATGSWDRTVALWDLDDPTDPRRLAGHTGAVTGVAFSDDGRTLISVGQDGTSMQWDVVDPAQPGGSPLPGDASKVSAMAVSPSRPVLATAGIMDDAVGLWDVTAPDRPELRGTVELARYDGAEALDFSHDGRRLAVGTDDGTVLLWDVTDPSGPRPLAEMGGPDSGKVHAVAVEPDGTAVLAFTDDFTVTRWDLTDPGDPRPAAREFGGDPGAVYSSTFDPAGRRLVTISEDGVVYLWDVTGGGPLDGTRMDADAGQAYAAAFAPDGLHMLTGNEEDDALLWDLGSEGDPRSISLRLTGETSLTAGAFAPDGRTVATGDSAGAILLWDVTDPLQPRRLGVPLSTGPDAVRVLVFSSDGRVLASGSDNTAPVLWDLNGLAELEDDVLQRSCRITGGGLDRTEWARHLPQLDYVDVCGG